MDSGLECKVRPAGVRSGQRPSRAAGSDQKRLRQILKPGPGPQAWTKDQRLSDVEVSKTKAWGRASCSMTATAQANIASTWPSRDIKLQEFDDQVKQRQQQQVQGEDSPPKPPQKRQNAVQEQSLPAQQAGLLVPEDDDALFPSLSPPAARPHCSRPPAAPLLKLPKTILSGREALDISPSATLPQNSPQETLRGAGHVSPRHYGHNSIDFRAAVVAVDGERRQPGRWPMGKQQSLEGARADTTPDPRLASSSNASARTESKRQPAGRAKADPKQPQQALRQQVMGQQGGAEAGPDLVGRRIKVWWTVNRRYYGGKVTAYTAQPDQDGVCKARWKVLDDHNGIEVLDLNHEAWAFESDDDVSGSQEDSARGLAKQVEGPISEGGLDRLKKLLALMPPVVGSSKASPAESSVMDEARSLPVVCCLLDGFFFPSHHLVACQCRACRKGSSTCGVVCWTPAGFAVHALERWQAAHPGGGLGWAQESGQAAPAAAAAREAADAAAGAKTAPAAIDTMPPVAALDGRAVKGKGESSEAAGAGAAGAAGSDGAAGGQELEAPASGGHGWRGEIHVTETPDLTPVPLGTWLDNAGISVGPAAHSVRTKRLAEAAAVGDEVPRRHRGSGRPPGASNAAGRGGGGSLPLRGPERPRGEPKPAGQPEPDTAVPGYQSGGINGSQGPHGTQLPATTVEDFLVLGPTSLPPPAAFAAAAPAPGASTLAAPAPAASAAAVLAADAGTEGPSNASKQLHGVSFEPRCPLPYRVRINVNNKRRELGLFATKEEAARRYDQALWHLYHSAERPINITHKLNFPRAY